MNLERQIRKANAVFMREFGEAKGTNHPLMAWFWSEDLLMIDNALDDAGNPIMDYICACGVNKDIHAPTCLASRAVSRMERVKIAPTLDRVWVLCRWNMPTLATWLACYGTEDNFPANGRYIPFSCADRTVTLPESSPPTEDDSALICRMIKANEDIPLATQIERWQENLDKRDEGARIRNRDAIRDAMPAFGSLPGTKMGTSFPSVTPKATIINPEPQKG